MSILIALVLSSLSVFILEILRDKVWQTRWAARDLRYSDSAKWRLARSLLAVTIGALIAIWWDEPLAAVTLSSVTWLGLLASETDLIGRRIPREPCWTVLGLGILGGALSGSLAGAASFALAFIAVGTILFLLAIISRGGLGSGDVRLFLAMTTLAWWIGTMPVIFALLLASVIQAVLRVGTLIFKRGSKYMPFGPALSAGAIVAAVVWPPALGGPCAEWLGVLSC